MLVNPDDYDDAVLTGGVNGGGCLSIMAMFLGTIFTAVGVGGLLTTMRR